MVDSWNEKVLTKETESYDEESQQIYWMIQKIYEREILLQ